MEHSKTGSRRNAVLIGIAAIALLAVIGFGLKSLLGGPGGKQPRAPKISLLPATPPPPPPPKEEKKPEPPKEQKEVKMQPVEQKQAPAPDNTLKMEGPAGNSPSPIQAGTVTNENLVKPEIGGGNPFAAYTSLMQKFLQDELARNRALTGKEYRISVMLWLDSAGRIEKINLTQSSGNPQTDALIRTALTSMPALKTPPENMPRPVGVRINSRG
jgi:periplasmic protein TonB